MRTNSIRLKPFIVLAPALLLAVARPADADTIHVNGDCGNDNWSGANPACVDPDGPKATIQAAIGAAINGDRIMVAAGTYRELINFLGKAIILRSSDGPEVTIIHGDIDNNGVGDGTVVSCINNETVLTVLDGFTITGGQAVRGGGMLNNSGSPTVTNCIFRLNIATSLGGGMHNLTNSNPTVTNCRFELNSTSNGGGMYSQNSSPTVINCSFSNNSASVGGGMSTSLSNLTVINCTFSDNAAEDGGAMWIFRDSPTVTNCIFTRNTAAGLGGGIHFLGSSTSTVVNCTFSQNAANVDGGAISGFATFANCIIWGNTSPGVDEIAGTPTVTYSDVKGGFPGEGNIDLNPIFVDPVNGDFHLSPASPCIDVGDPAMQPLGGRDLDGNMRVWNDRVDMGCYEFGSFVFGDLNCDGAFNGGDIDPFFLALGDPAAYLLQFPTCDPLNGDMNGDGRLDGGDIDPFFACLGGGQCP